MRGFSVWSRETERLLRLREAVQAELRRFRDVVGVGVGLRQRRGLAVAEPTFRVYVRRKLPRSIVGSRELIPSLIAGVQTDVNEVGFGKAECSGAIRPVLAGVQIVAGNPGEIAEFGTLGCFLNGVAGSAAVGLTNNHVTRSIFPQLVHQPEPGGSCGGQSNVIGQTLPEFGFEGEEGGVFLDLAIIKLENTEFLRRFSVPKVDEDDAQEIALPGGDGSILVNPKNKIVSVKNAAGDSVNLARIAGSTSATMNQSVWKIGGTTGLTVGQVLDVAGTAVFNVPGGQVTAENQVLVQPVAGYQDQSGTNRFSKGGDSGSVYVNLTNEVVALHHHSTPGSESEPIKALGSPIAAILQKLGGGSVATSDEDPTVNAMAPSTLRAREAWAGTRHDPVVADHLWGALRLSLLETARGALLLRAADRHLAEVYRLVWGRRAVTAVWHRNQGPAFVAYVHRNLHAGRTQIPRQIGGVSLQQLAGALLDILETHGSSQLREDVRELRCWLPELAVGGEFEEIIARFKTAA